MQQLLHGLGGFDPGYRRGLHDLDLCLDLFTDPEVVRYTVGRPMSEEAIHEKMSDWLRRGADGWIGIWRISDRETGEKYGTTALLRADYALTDDWLLTVETGTSEVAHTSPRTAVGTGLVSEPSATIVLPARTSPRLPPIGVLRRSRRERSS